MDDLIDEILKYCREEYNFIVLRGDRNNYEFWTLEETETAASFRVYNETKGYDNDPEFQFFYLKLKRTKFGTEIDFN